LRHGYKLGLIPGFNDKERIKRIEVRRKDTTLGGVALSDRPPSPHNPQKLEIALKLSDSGEKNLVTIGLFAQLPPISRMHGYFTGWGKP